MNTGLRARESRKTMSKRRRRKPLAALQGQGGGRRRQGREDTGLSWPSCTTCAPTRSLIGRPSCSIEQPRVWCGRRTAPGQTLLNLTTSGADHVFDILGRHGMLARKRQRRRIGPSRQTRHGDARAQRHVVRRLQGAVQDRRRHLLLSAELDRRRLQPLPLGLPGTTLDQRR